MVDLPILYSPKSYLGKNSLFGESNPPLIGSLIIPPCTWPANTKSAPHFEYPSKKNGVCTNNMLYSLLSI